MRYILASNNKGKLKEIKAILSDFGSEVISQSEAGLSLEAEETGVTFEENALIKARAACEALSQPAIADDSGLAVESLGGAPGVYSARYGGCTTDEERVSLLLRNLEGIENRRAKFVSCIACAFPNGDIITARGECEGRITDKPRGDGGFGYDPVFEIPTIGKTMAELSPEEKNAVSHRGKALRIFEMKLREYNADK
ncbi:MAG: XTP/dITP diphosphatase [Oscillospiraceae bacterium]|nr:XTP/dITP diphosphatase [Oscillospiraceae bacterium]